MGNSWLIFYPMRAVARAVTVARGGQPLQRVFSETLFPKKAQKPSLCYVHMDISPKAAGWTGLQNQGELR
jgi:hypothetical protein